MKIKICDVAFEFDTKDVENFLEFVGKKKKSFYHDQAEICSTCKFCEKINRGLNALICLRIDKDPIIKIPIGCFDYERKKNL